MRKSTLTAISIVLAAFFISGCATNIPMTSTLNDFVMMGTKTNGSEKVSFSYESNVVDGLIKPFEKDKVKEVSGHPGFNHTESSTLGRILNEYMENKFSNLDPNGQTTVRLILKEFWLEQYSTDSNGKQFVAAMFGGETNIKCAAKVKAILIVNRNDKELIKNINITSEDFYVSGIGTGTSTSNIYRGKNSLAYTHANNINKANNKVVMMVNSYFEEIGL
jgi:hypothetical protein